MSRVPIPPKDALKMRGLDGTRRPARAQGVVMHLNANPINRAQRRFLARLKRRQQKEQPRTRSSE